MSVVMDIIRIAVVVAVRFINQRQKAVETEKNGEIREAKDKNSILSGSMPLNHPPPR